jgi:hypothetical protein
MIMENVFKTAAYFEGEEEIGLQWIDTVFFDSCWWLVGIWHTPKGATKRSPLRALLLDSIPHRKSALEGTRFELVATIPRSVLIGKEERPAYASLHSDFLIEIQAPPMSS